MSIPLLCVHASAFGKDVVLRFAGARYAVEGGALCVRAVEAPHGDMMSLAPGVWKAAWHEDGLGAPLGLMPEGESGFAAPSPPSPEKAASPEPGDADGLKAQASARAALEGRVLVALESRSYEGLTAFSAFLGEPPGEIERSLIAALQRKAIDPGAISLPAVQAKLDASLPDIIAVRQPQGVREIMQHLRQNPDTRECDYVQLNIWLRRNPVKRGP